LAISLSRRVARFNRSVTNPIQSQYAWLLPPWAVICHRGRRSGRLYRTPVNAYRRGQTIAIVVLYGEQSDWVQNVLAGGGQIVRGGRTYELLDPRVVARASRTAGVAAAGVAGAPGEWPGSVPAPARMLGRLSGTLLVAGLGEPSAGRGRGPR
jgi:deazaflavin-dependent oxidoreductase (nitroreductase family)